jgi:hypothetical protein
VSLNDKETLLMKKSIKQKEIQVANMKTLAKIISIVATYVFLVENESLLNNKFINHEETNNEIHTTTSSLTSNILFSLIWMEILRCLVFIPFRIEVRFHL